jgi:hypothetical protein
MTETLLPGRTAWETRAYLKDRGHRAAVIQAHRQFADMLETDEDCPVPPGNDIVVGAASSTGAVDRWAKRNHVKAGWNGRVYKASVNFGAELTFAVIHIPAKILDEELAAECVTAVTA